MLTVIGWELFKSMTTDMCYWSGNPEEADIFIDIEKIPAAIQEVPATEQIFTFGSPLSLMQVGAGAAATGLMMFGLMMFGYRKYKAHLKGEIDSLNDALEDRDKEIASLQRVNLEREGKISSLNDALEDRDKEISSLQRVNLERKEEISSLNDALEDRDKEISSLQRVNLEREEEISSLTDALEGRDKEISSLQRDRDKEISSLQRVNLEREQEISSLNDTLEDRDNEISSLKRTNLKKEKELLEMEERLREQENNRIIQQTVEAALNTQIAELALEAHGLLQALNGKTYLIDKLEKQQELLQEQVIAANAENAALRHLATDQKEQLVKKQDEFSKLETVIEEKNKQLEEDRLVIEELENQEKLAADREKILQDEIRCLRANVQVMNEVLDDLKKRNLDDYKLTQELKLLLNEAKKDLNILEVENAAKVEELEGKNSSLHEQVLNLEQQKADIQKEKELVGIQLQEIEAALNTQIAELALEANGLLQALNGKTILIDKLEKQQELLQEQVIAANAENAALRHLATDQKEQLVKKKDEFSKLETVIEEKNKQLEEDRLVIEELENQEKLAADREKILQDEIRCLRANVQVMNEVLDDLKKRNLDDYKLTQELKLLLNEAKKDLDILEVENAAKVEELEGKNSSLHEQVLNLEQQKADIQKEKELVGIQLQEIEAALNTQIAELALEANGLLQALNGKTILIDKLEKQQELLQEQVIAANAENAALRHLATDQKEQLVKKKDEFSKLETVIEEKNKQLEEDRLVIEELENQEKLAADREKILQDEIRCLRANVQVMNEVLDDLKKRNLDDYKLTQELKLLLNEAKKDLNILEVENAAKVEELEGKNSSLHEQVLNLEQQKADIQKEKELVGIQLQEIEAALNTQIAELALEANLLLQALNGKTILIDKLEKQQELLQEQVIAANAENAALRDLATDQKEQLVKKQDEFSKLETVIEEKNKQLEEDRLVIEELENQEKLAADREKILQDEIRCLRANVQVKNEVLDDLKKRNLDDYKLTQELKLLLNEAKKDLNILEVENAAKVEELEGKNSSLHEQVLNLEQQKADIQKEKELVGIQLQEIEAALNTQIAELALEANGLLQALNGKTILIDKLEKQQELLQEQVIAANAENAALRHLATDQKEQLVKKQDEFSKLETVIEEKNKQLEEDRLVIEELENQEKLAADREKILQDEIRCLRANVQVMNEVLDDLKKRNLDDYKLTQELKLLLNEAKKDLNILEVENAAKVEELEGKNSSLHEQVLNLEQQKADIQKEKELVGIQLQEIEAALNTQIAELALEANGLLQALNGKTILIDKLEKQQELLQEQVIAANAENAALRHLATDQKEQLVKKQDEFSKLETVIEEKNKQLEEDRLVIEELENQEKLAADREKILQDEIRCLRANVQVMNEVLDDLKKRNLDDYKLTQELKLLLNEAKKDLNILEVENAAKVEELEGKNSSLHEQVLNLEQQKADIQKEKELVGIQLQEIEAALNTQIAELALEANGLLQALNGKTILIDKLEKQQELLQEQVIAANAENAALRDLATDQKEQLVKKQDEFSKLETVIEEKNKQLEEDRLVIEELENQEKLAADREKILQDEIRCLRANVQVMNEVLDDLKKRNLDDYKLTQELKLLLNEAKKDLNILEVENAAKVEELEGKNSSLHEQVLNLEQQKADIQKEKELVGIQLQEIEAALNTQIAELALEANGLLQALNGKTILIDKLEKQQELLQEQVIAANAENAALRHLATDQKEQLVKKQDEFSKLETVIEEKNKQLEEDRLVIEELENQEKLAADREKILQDEIRCLRANVQVMNEVLDDLKKRNLDDYKLTQELKLLLNEAKKDLNILEVENAAKVEELEGKNSSLHEQVLNLEQQKADIQKEKELVGIQLQEIEAALNTQIAELALEANGLLQALNGKTILIDKLEKQQELLQEQVIAANAENAALRDLATDQKEQLVKKQDEFSKLETVIEEKNKQLEEDRLVIEELENQEKLAADREKILQDEIRCLRANVQVMNEVLDDLKKRNLDDYKLTQELKLLLNEAKKDLNILEVENAAKVEELEGKNSSLHEQVLNLEQQKADIQKEKELVGIQLQEIEAALNTQIAELALEANGLLQALNGKTILIDKLEKQQELLQEQVIAANAENAALRDLATDQKEQLVKKKDEFSKLETVIEEKNKQLEEDRLVIEELENQEKLAADREKILQDEIRCLRANVQVMSEALDDLKKRNLDDYKLTQELKLLLNEAKKDLNILEVENAAKVEELEGKNSSLHEQVLNLEQQKADIQKEKELVGIQLQEIEAALNTQIAKLALEANGLLQALNGKTILIDKLEKQQELLQEKVIAADAENVELRELATDQNEQLVKKKDEFSKLETVIEEKNKQLEEDRLVIEELENQEKLAADREKILQDEIRCLRANVQVMSEALDDLKKRNLDDYNLTQRLKWLLKEANKDLNILEGQNATKVEQLEGEISTLHEQVLNLKQQLADIQKQKDMVEIQLQEIDAVTNLLIVNLEFEISSLHQDLNLRIDVIRKLENDHTRLVEEMAIDKRKVEELNNALEERDNEISSMKKIIQENEEKAEKMEEQLKEEQEERRKGEEEQRHTLEERENEISFLKKTILEKEKEIQIMEERLEINEVKRGIQKKKIDFLLKEIEEKIAQINLINLEQELGNEQPGKQDME
ncbi:GRIP and coiled-coil domain-containing protein 2-like [Palaemon carinicauda]|uniref:GRIP and coiled-coil domain-containing protein 2-like n=1 Tax=Palaemon carinicauda TaxID=392227 RepID=UPI0035B65BB8